MNTENETQPTILIVDDEHYVRQSFCDYFEDRCWEIFSASSGEAALELLKDQACSAAIVDIRMGGMDGETFIRHAYENHPKMVFVICTGSPEYEASQDVLQKPFVSEKVFSKPVTDIENLEKTIVRLLEKNKLV